MGGRYFDLCPVSVSRPSDWSAPTFSSASDSELPVPPVRRTTTSAFGFEERRRGTWSSGKYRGPDGRLTCSGDADVDGYDAASELGRGYVTDDILTDVGDEGGMDDEINGMTPAIGRGGRGLAMAAPISKRKPG